jgi:hypothetical protein
VHPSSGWDELYLDGVDPTHAESLLSADPRFEITRRGSRVLSLDQPADDLIAALGSSRTRRLSGEASAGSRRTEQNGRTTSQVPGESSRNSHGGTSSAGEARDEPEPSPHHDFARFNAL